MGFRRITFHFDRPDILSKYKVRLEGDKKKFPGKAIAANARKNLSRRIIDKKHYQFRKFTIIIVYGPEHSTTYHNIT